MRAHDFRYALRTLWKQPIFSLAALLTLSLAIGTNTAIFSVVYHTLLRPLPYRDPERLAIIRNAHPKAGSGLGSVSIPDYLDRRGGAPSLEDAALFTPKLLTLTGDRQPEQLAGLAVTPSFFSTLGRDPLLGRRFADHEAHAGADKVAILTHGTWTTHFGGDAGVVGRSIRLNGEAHTIVGVLSRDFELPQRNVALVVPFVFTAEQMSDAERGNEFSLMIGRLREGASIEALNAEMQTIVNRLIDRLPARAAFMRNSGFTGAATPLREYLIGDVRLSLYMLQAGVALVLLIACANVANLLLMRAAGRRGELAIRLSLGASRWHIVRQLLADGCVLCVLGGLGGMLLAGVSVRGLISLAAEQLPETPATVFAPVVAMFTLGLTALTTLIFAAVPALHAPSDRIVPALKDDGTRGRSGSLGIRTRSTLVVAETALAVVLLVVAGLLVKGFIRLQRVDPGFSPSHVLTARVSLPPTRYTDAEAQTFWFRLLDGVRRTPGVTAAGLISTVPLSGSLSSGTYRVVGRALGPEERPPHGRIDLVAGDYVRALGIPLVEGRLLTDSDIAESARVAIVDRFLAEQQFPGRSAVGQQLNFRSQRIYTIVGVVGTIRDADLAQPADEGRIYLSALQIPSTTMTLTVRSAGDPSAIGPHVRAVVQAIDPEQAIADVRTMDDWIARSVSGRRPPAPLLGAFAAISVVLAVIGIYGVVAFGVTERVHEFGIRQALGADRRSILGFVLKEGLRTTGVGVLLGMGLAALATPSIRSMVFGVEQHDPVIFGGVALLLMAVSAAACSVPAWRATRVDPMVALRQP